MSTTQLIHRIPEKAQWRRRLATLIDHPRMQMAIIVVICINAVVLGMEAVPSIMDRWYLPLKIIDRLCLAIFVVELLIKAIAYRGHMLRSGWNVFDVVVVTIALIPASGPLAVLRSLRVLRVFRLITAIPSLKRVVAAFLHAIPGLGAVGVLLAVVMFVSAVMANGFFGASHPQWFGSLGTSLFTLFQIMTLESWSMGIVRPVMETQPYAWLFFVPFIVCATFAILNLFIGIIVSTIQELDTSNGPQSAPRADTAIENADEILNRIEQDLARLREMSRRQRAQDGD